VIGICSTYHKGKRHLRRRGVDGNILDFILGK
jgi:hypothetical protein